MESPSVTKTDRAQSLDQDIHRLRQQLDVLKKHLMTEPSAETLNEFDAVTEDLLAEAFGSSSHLLDTYEYAEVGEAAGLMNLPDEAPEGTDSQSQRETIRQRLRVLESAIADLEGRRASLAQATRKRTNTGPRVSDFMAGTVRSISLDATLREAGQCLQKWKIGSLLVQSGDEYIGSISETELTSEVVASGTDATTTTVKTCMREPLVTIETSDPIVEAVRLMKERGTRHLAVIESGRIVGVVSVSDVLRYYSGVV
ncbi:MAG: CBS domain-containing protein [Nitrospirota bacterium]|nr:MAG: CBS domain-containing protein [Nitrospirota bacterium]